VTGTSSPAVIWSVNDVPGGNSTVGAVSTSGLYTAPAVPPSPNTVTVKATSVSAPTATGSTEVTVNNPAPVLESIAPTSTIAGPADVLLVATGTGFAIQSVVMLGSTALHATLDSPTQLTAVVTANQLANAGPLPVTVQTPSPGGGVSQPASFTVNHTPAITSAASATFVVGTAGSFTIVAKGFPAPTLSETGALPGGVTFDSSTGVLCGTPAASTGGTYNLSFEASNGVGTDATQSFNLTVDQAPAITSATSATFVAGAAGSFTVTATGYPAPTLSRTGALPNGVTFNASTGALSGTPAAGAGGTYNLSFKASNGVGTDADQTLVLTVNEATTITSAASATFTVATADSFTVVTTGFPAPTLTETGTLPGGVTFNSATGVLSGTPAAGTGGTYNVTFRASNGIGTDPAQNFTLTVNQAPAFTSAGSASFTVGTAGSFAVTAMGFPAPTLTGTGTLPGGVTFNSTTGVLSGTPATGAGGTYNVTLRASNGVATDANQSFVLTVNEATTITSAASASFTVGTAGSFTVIAGGYPAPTLSQTGTLPSGVTFNSSTGVLSGTPAAGTGGTYTISLKASNGVGTDASQTFALTVNETPTITSANSATFTAETTGSFTVTATGFPTPTLSEKGTLPSGVSFDEGTGVMSGTPAASTGGTYSLTFTASNGASPDAAQNFTLTINEAPVITSANNTTFTVGTAGSFTVTAPGFPTPTFSESGALPSGVTLVTSGLLSGTPGANAGGIYNITLTAANGVGANATQSFTLTVDNPVPVLYSISPNAVNAANPGDPDTTLTVGGADFTGQSVVYFNATALATDYGSATQLTATIPASLLPSASTTTTAITENITVMTSAPGGASTSLTLTVWPTYPRSDATSVLTGPPPALTQIPQNGTVVAVLDWTSKDNLPGGPEDVLSADHLVSELGIPTADVSAVPSPTTYPFLLVAGVLNTPSPTLSSTDVTNLYDYVNGGGTLYLWEPNVSSLLTALGINSPPAVYNETASQEEQRPLIFNKTAADYPSYPLVKYIDAPEEINWAPYFPTGDVTRGYSIPMTGSGCTPLATWSTGDYAVLRCNIGTGRAYVFGWRLRPLMELPQLQLGNDTGPQGVNAIVPDSDICRMMMRGSYEAYAANPRERQWAPGGHHAALIITYDNDAVVSYQNVPATVDFNESLGINATYNFTTLPYDSGYIAPMYSAAGKQDVQYAVSHGFDVEGEGLGHFPDFGTAPYTVGPPTEDASNYMPMFKDDGTGQCCTSGLSVIGEVGVSKWLLEHDFNIKVNGIRSGFTLVPPTFIQGLAVTGYQRDQSYLICLTRGAFPFAAFTLDTSTNPYGINAYPIMEYPMSISDDAASYAGLTGLNTSTVSQYVQVWEHIIKFNYDNNAPTVVLIHPVDTTARFQVLEQVLDDLKSEGYDLWVGDLTTFGKFWEAQGVTNATGW
jgi:hypothetical protein